MTPLIHNYSHLAGQTTYWDTSDSKEIFEKNCKDPQKLKILQEHGFVEHPVLYRFNSHGFRTSEFDRPADIVCFGCSFTMGTGVHEEHTWPSQLADRSGMTVLNLGHAGSSNDTAFRFAQHYLADLRPKIAIWLQTDKHRIELLDDHIPNSQNFLIAQTQLATENDYFLKTWFSSYSNQELNLSKNTLAFKYLCHELNVSCMIIPRNKISNDFSARDFQHPGAKAQGTMANWIYNQLVSQHIV